MLLNVTISSSAPMLQHNGELVCPTNKWALAMKEITKKRAKTAADLIELARLEYYGGIVLTDEGRPGVPGEWLEACIKEGAKKTKQGKEATATVVVDGIFPLEYKGPQTVEDLWADKSGKFVKSCGARIAQAKVWRTRPMFPVWKLTFCLEYLHDIVDEKTVLDWLETAGRVVGIGDWRPKYGRFVIEHVERVDAAPSSKATLKKGKK